jgi:hypothetical protein
MDYSLESRLVNVLDNNYKCPICLDIKINASTLPCAHDFCDKCIRHVNSKCCPICRAKFSDIQIVPAYHIRIPVSKLNIRCVFTENKCIFTGPLSDMVEHEKKCNFNIVNKLMKDADELTRQLNAIKEQISEEKKKILYSGIYQHELDPEVQQEERRDSERFVILSPYREEIRRAIERREEKMTNIERKEKKREEERHHEQQIRRHREMVESMQQYAEHDERTRQSEQQEQEREQREAQQERDREEREAKQYAEHDERTRQSELREEREERDREERDAMANDLII